MDKDQLTPNKQSTVVLHIAASRAHKYDNTSVLTINCGDHQLLPQIAYLLLVSDRKQQTM